MMTASRRLGTLLCASAMMSTMAFAADHGDAPASIAIDAASDIADLYSWMDGDDVVLVATTPAATFSDAVQYTFHVGSGADFAAAGGTSSTTVICTFDSAQVASCWLGTPGSAPTAYVTGDASATAGIENAAGTFKVFAGLRDDPFFFNGGGFVTVVDTAVGAVVGGSLSTFDAGNCPDIDGDLGAGTAAALVTQLGFDDGDQDSTTDDFAGGNVSAIVVSIDKTLLNAGGDILSVWASTNQ